MFGKYARLRVALAIGCLVVAVSAAQAQANSRSTDTIPGNLRALVLKFGSECGHMPKSLHLDGDCENALATNTHNQLGKFLVSIAPICNSLRPNSLDGKASYIWVVWTPLYSQLSCYWRGAPGANPGVAIGISVPNAGRRLPAPSCSDALYSGPEGFCHPVAGGVSWTKSYSTIDFYGEDAVATSLGSVSINRHAKSSAAYFAAVTNDPSVIMRLAKVMHLPAW